MVSDGQQAVGIRWQVDAHNVGALIGYHVEKSRVLVGESIVILPPNQASDQEVERRYPGSPGKLVALFQPLGVLIEHRVNNMNERLIAVYKAVATTQDISLQPPLNS